MPQGIIVSLVGRVRRMPCVLGLNAERRIIDLLATSYRKIHHGIHFETAHRQKKKKLPSENAILPTKLGKLSYHYFCCDNVCIDKFTKISYFLICCVLSLFAWYN